MLSLYCIPFPNPDICLTIRIVRITAAAFVQTFVDGHSYMIWNVVFSDVYNEVASIENPIEPSTAGPLVVVQLEASIGTLQSAKIRDAPYRSLPSNLCVSIHRVDILPVTLRYGQDHLSCCQKIIDILERQLQEGSPVTQ